MFFILSTYGKSIRKCNILYSSLYADEPVILRSDIPDLFVFFIKASYLSDSDVCAFFGVEYENKACGLDITFLPADMVSFKSDDLTRHYDQNI